MKKFTYEITFLTTVVAQDEDKSLDALETKFPTNNGRVNFHNIEAAEIYCTLFEIKGIGEEE